MKLSNGLSIRDDIMCQEIAGKNTKHTHADVQRDGYTKHLKRHGKHRIKNTQYNTGVK
jgi:hypothetical protein